MAIAVEHPQTVAVPYGRWLAASDRLGTSVPMLAAVELVEIVPMPGLEMGTVIEMTVQTLVPYPCLCAPPCRTRGEKTCPCHGRRDIATMPDHCCARFEVAASRWTMPETYELDQRHSEPTQPAVPAKRWAAPLIIGLDGVPRFRAPLQPLPGTAGTPRRRWHPPRRGDCPDWAPPRHPGFSADERKELGVPWCQPGQADCWICGEPVSAHLVSLGIERHIGC